MGLGIGNIFSFGAPPGSGTGGGGGGNSSGVQKYATNFVGVTSGLFTHALGSTDVLVQVEDTQRKVIIPNNIIVQNINQITLLFNKPQSGRLIIMG